MKLTKNADPDQYGYSGYGIVFEGLFQFLWLVGSLVKTVVIFGVHNSSSVHGDNNKKWIRQGLDHFQESGKRFVSSLHCNGNNNLDLLMQ